MFHLCQKDHIMIGKKAQERKGRQGEKRLSFCPDSFHKNVKSRLDSLDKIVPDNSTILIKIGEHLANNSKNR